MNAWSIRPDWSGNYTTNYAYKTEAFSSRSGKEQRRALRHSPRFYCEFDFQAPMVDFDRLMFGKQNQQFIMPDYTESDTLAAATTIGGTTVQVAAVQPWMRNGEYVSVDGVSAHLVTNVSGTTLTVSPNLSAAWPIGTTLFHAYRGFVQPTLQVDTPVNTISKGKIRFDAIPASLAPLTPPAAAVTWNGREVFLKRPNWANSPQIEYNWQVEAVDFGRGAATYYQVIDFCSKSVKATYLGKTRAEVLELRNFFDRMRGMRGEFYAPTWNPDLELVGNISSGSHTLTAKGTTVPDNTAYRQLVVVKVDGTLIYNEVASMSVVAGDTPIVCANAWPAINAADVLMVCWMPAWTLASDILTVSWASDQVANVGIAMRTVDDIDV